MFHAVADSGTATAAVGSISTAAASVPSVRPGAVVDASRAIGAPIGWTLLTLVIGALLIGAFPAAVRSIRTEVVDRPDLAFATGFVVFFGLLLVASFPLIAAMLVDQSLIGIGGLVAVPGLLLWVALLFAGGALGVVVVGDRIAERIGQESPSLRRALAVGALAVGATQFVPVLGALVAMGAATVGIGGAVRRRYDDRWFVVGDASADRDSTASAEESSVANGRRGSSEVDVWRSNEPTAAESEATDDGVSTATSVRSDAATGRAGTDDKPRWIESESVGNGADRTADEWRVDDWEWDLEVDDDESDDAEPETETDRDGRR